MSTYNEKIYDARRRRKRALDLFEYKGGKCQHCDIRDLEHIEIYDYHHVNSEEKLFNVGGRLTAPKDRLYKEADKCLLLCANCHKKEHARIRKEARDYEV